MGQNWQNDTLTQWKTRLYIYEQEIDKKSLELLGKLLFWRSILRSQNCLRKDSPKSTQCDAKRLLLSQNGVLFRTCEDGVGWHLIPYRISPRSEFFSQAYKTWHITWGINLGPDWPPLARGSKFYTIHTPTRSLNFLP